jgi:hypothetical protein
VLDRLADVHRAAQEESPAVRQLGRSHTMSTTASPTSVSFASAAATSTTSRAA